MLNQFSSKLACVDWFCPSLFECRMTVLDAETVLDDAAYSSISRDVGKFHLFTVPFQDLVQALQTDSYHTHYDHFVEWTSFCKIRCRRYTCFSVFLTSTYPVLLVRQSHLTTHLGHFRIASRYQIRLLTVATANQDVLGTIEDNATTVVVHVLACHQCSRTFWNQTTVVPIYIHFRHSHLRHVVTCREGILHELCVRARFRQQQSRRTLNLGRIAQVQALEYRMEDVASHVTQRTCTEIPPATEVPRSIDRIVRTHRSRADEGIPVQCRRYSRSFCRTFQALRPNRTVSESFYLSHFTDNTVPNPVTNLTHTFLRCTLVTHLGSHFMLGSQLGEQTRFVYRVSQRLFAIHVLTCCDSFCTDNGVSMVGSGTNHSVALVKHFSEHHLVVIVSLGIRIAFEHRCCIFPVHVAQTDDVFSFQSTEHSSTTSTDTYTQNLELTILGTLFLLLCIYFCKHAARSHGQTDSSCRTCFQERSSRHFFSHLIRILWLMIIFLFSVHQCP